MALIGKPDPLSDLGEGQMGPAHQGLCPLQSALRNKALRTNSDRLLEGAAKVIGAKTGNPSKIHQGQSTIKMGFDVVPHPLQSLAGQAA
jgi:hypothetical protein